MRALAVAAFLLGCGPHAPPISLRESMDQVYGRMVDKLIELSAQGDARGLARLLDRSLGFGGMWFPDTDCRRQLGVAGTIPASAIETFAGCLATVRLQRSARTHSYPDVAVLTYEPGIEIEVFLGSEDGDKAKVGFIGYVGRNRKRDALPTVSEQALRAARTDTAALVLDEATTMEIERERAHSKQDKTPVFAWFKVCIDAAGAVTSVQPRLTSSIAAQHALAVHVRSWVFRPFKLGDQPSPVCSLVYLEAPDSPPGKRGQILPAPVPERHAADAHLNAGALGPVVSGSGWIKPPIYDLNFMRERGIRLALATMFYCIDETGKVDSLELMRPSGFVRWDNRLRSGVAKWRHAPYQSRGAPVRACTHRAFAMYAPQGSHRIIEVVGP